MLLKYVLFYKVSNNQLLLYELTEPNCKLDSKVHYQLWPTYLPVQR